MKHGEFKRLHLCEPQLPPETNLSARMRAAYRDERNRDRLPENWLELADKFDSAAADYQYGTMKVQQFLGHFARARKAWCKFSGEPLV